MDLKFCAFIAFLWLVILLIAKLRSSKKNAKGSCVDYSYYRLNSSILTKTELSFFKILRSAVPAEFHITIKPRIADFISTKPYDHSSFNRISRKHVDFLICSSHDLSPVLAIELDDSSHQAQKVKNRDRFIETLYAEVSLPILRIPVTRFYKLSQLKSQILRHIKTL